MGQLFPDERKIGPAEIVACALVWGFGFLVGATLVVLIWWLS